MNIVQQDFLSAPKHIQLSMMELAISNQYYELANMYKKALAEEEQNVKENQKVSKTIN